MSYPEPKEVDNPKEPKQKPIWKVRGFDSITYFTNLNDIIVHEECRWNLSKEEKLKYKAKKIIAQRHRISEKNYEWNLKDVNRILCHLPEMDKSTAKRIYFGEGAKVMTALEEWGYTATCVTGGAKCYNQGEDFLPLLKFDEIILLEDHDKDGAKFIHQIAIRLSRLIRKNKSKTKLKRLDVCPWVKGGDFWDFQQGDSREKLQKEFDWKIDDAPFYDPITAAQKSFEAEEDLEYEYGRDDDLLLLNDFLEIAFDTDCLRFIINENDTKGKFWSFFQPVNTWTKHHDEFIRQKIIQFARKCKQRGGKKDYVISDRSSKNLIGLLKVHDWTLVKGEFAKAGYNFLSIPDNIDDELLIPHLNGNLYVELKSPYRRILQAATSNHFHKSVRPWNYAEPGLGGEMESKLQPKIHNDWFKNDEEGCKLFYEIGGYILVQKNTGKKIIYWLKETQAGKKVGMFQIEQLIGEDNIFPSKVLRSKGNFGQSMWLGKRLITYPDLKQDSNSDNSLLSFGQQLAEVSGGDRCNIEGKNRDEIAARLECHFILVSNADVTIPDQQGEQIARAIFLPWEHNIVEDSSIVTDANLTDKLNIEQELQIFEKLCLDADKARRIRGGDFSHSKYEDEYKKEFIRKGDNWVQFVEDSMEPIEFPKDFDYLESKEKIKYGIFSDEYVERAKIWFIAMKNTHLQNTDSRSVGINVSTALKKLGWETKRSTAERKVIMDKKQDKIVTGIRYGIKWKSNIDYVQNPD